MATIKQISEKSGYSPSTVSIVLRGLSTERGIPDSTQQVIMDTARELGYQPNVSARRLRSDEPEKKNIAVFWATDFRAILVAKFLQGLQRFILEHQLDLEVVVCPYSPNSLFKSATQRTLNMYSGAIICTASVRDMDYVEQLNTTCPIVLYNRISKRFPCVGVDNNKVGRCVANKFLSDCCQKVWVVTDCAELEYSRLRIQGFKEELQNTGVIIEEIYADSNSISQGRLCAKNIILSDEKTGIFAMSDFLAFGILNELTEQQVKIPDHVEMISIGTSELDLYHCFRPALSVIEIPIEEMAYRCVEVLYDRLSRISQDFIKIEVPFQVSFSETTF